MIGSSGASEGEAQTSRRFTKSSVSDPLKLLLHGWTNQAQTVWVSSGHGRECPPIKRFFRNPNIIFFIEVLGNTGFSPVQEAVSDSIGCSNCWGWSAQCLCKSIKKWDIDEKLRYNYVSKMYSRSSPALQYRNLLGRVWTRTALQHQY